MHELPIDPGQPTLPPYANAPAAWRVPTIWAAVGLIALYFALQLSAGLLASLVVGIREGLYHPDEGMDLIKTRVMDVLQQPDNNAVLVIVALPLIAVITFATARHYWPCMWSMPQPPGFGIARPQSLFWFGVALLVGVVLPPLGGVLTALLAHGHALTQNVEELGHNASTGFRIPLAIIIVGVGPLVEELLFRGVLLAALMRRLSMTQSIAICALLFALVHLQGLHFQWYALPSLLLLAVALCWLRLQSASLWPAVLAHSVYNLFGMIALFATATTSPY
jgi:uncharacterized protein